MEITKLEHSGLIISKNGKRIVFDPVEFEKTVPKIESVVAIIITHKHGDHLQAEVLNRILDSNPGTKVLTTNDTAPLIGGATVAKAGDVYELDGFKLEFFGKDHAAIVPGQIPRENVGAVINDAVVNPGDSFDYPNVAADVLLAPVSAPWLKVSESMDFINKAKPRMVIPIHDALLSELGEAITGGWIKKACEDIGAEYKELKPNESVMIA